MLCHLGVRPAAGHGALFAEGSPWRFAVAPGAGPVKTKLSLHAAGNTELTSTEELLSFTKG